eukprot:Hpha_TRINITY_DN6671_c0_g1::TRINITY_DN6671_c0_g1_i1::g.26450::m.26450
MAALGPAAAEHPLPDEPRGERRHEPGEAADAAQLPPSAHSGSHDGEESDGGSSEGASESERELSEEPLEKPAQESQTVSVQQAAEPEPEAPCSEHHDFEVPRTAPTDMLESEIEEMMERYVSVSEHILAGARMVTRSDPDNESYRVPK